MTNAHGVARDQLTVEMVREFFDYDPSTGELHWLQRNRLLFSTERHFRTWNSRFAGKVAGSVDNYGYHYVRVYGVRYKKHRVVWAYETGEWPVGEVDHVNGDVADNRFCNLRDVSHAKNCRNQSLRCTNSSGFTGVSWNTAMRKWQSYVKQDGKKSHLGYFDRIEDAHSAYAKRARELGFTERHIFGEAA